MVVLIGCAGSLAALRRIPDRRVQQAYAVLIILEHRRCATAANEVELGWSHDRLKRRFGDRLTVGPPSGGRPAAPGLPVIEREAHLDCQRPHSVRQFDHGVITDYLFSLDATGKVVSIEVADHRYVDD